MNTPETRGALVDALKDQAACRVIVDPEFAALLREAADALARPADGWVLVPRTPTDAMHEAAYSAADNETTEYERTVMWDAMISATPTQPASDTAASVQQGEG
jgi:hypothetical protein